MQRHVIVCCVVIAVCLLSGSAIAQHAGPSSKQATVSDDDFIKLQQQITELKDPTFRAFLRMRLLSWEPAEPSAVRRQAAIEVATQGLRDLCQHQDQIWSPTASWLHESLVNRLKSFQSPEEAAVAICVLNTKTNIAEKEFASAVRMLRNPETSATGLDLAKAAVLSGQVSPEALLGQLTLLSTTQSPHLSELLNTILALEEKQPGALTLRMMPFFSSVFLDKHVAPETLTRFLPVAVRYSRVSAEDLAKPTVRSPVATLLNGIVIPAKRFAPELYPEIASRLNSLNANAANRTETRLAAEERIQNASDQLDQLISEANSASDQQLKESLFFRAARLAKEQGHLSKAVDLAMKVVNDRKLDINSTTRSWLNDFLSQIVSAAVRKNSPRDATYAISKMTEPLAKANAFRLLGQSYAENHDKVKSKEAFTESAKQLKSMNNSNEKVKACLLLAESVLQYEPADAYEAFRESVKAVNNLERIDENTDYRKLLPVAEDLIRSFRLLATRGNQTAITLAAEIKLSELRVAALTGSYSGHAVRTAKKF